MINSQVREFRQGLRSLERQVELVLASQTECCGVTPAQCHLLLQVEGAGEASVGELASALELDASTLSRTVDGLVKAGLLGRREDPENRRRLIISLSPRGKRKAEEINTMCDRYYADFLKSLSPSEARSLTKILPILVRALRSWREAWDDPACCTGSKEAT